jgi:hypothetical protein
MQGNKEHTMTPTKETHTMTPYDATLVGLDAGAAGIRLEMDNGTLKVYHTEGNALLLDVKNVKAGTWDAIWALMKASGKVKFQAK